MSSWTDARTSTVDDRRERRAVGWLTAGLLLLPIGLVVGWYHVLTAPRWSWHAKIVAALLPGPLVAVVLMIRADLDAVTCRTPGVSASSICVAEPAAGIVKGGVVLALLGVLAWMMIHLDRAARSQREFAVVDRTYALVLVVVAVFGAQTLLGAGRGPRPLLLRTVRADVGRRARSRRLIASRRGAW